VLTLFLAPLLQCVSDIQTLSVRQANAVALNQNLSSSSNTTDKLAFYAAIAEAAQALSWVSSTSPLMHVTQARANFSQLKTNPGLNSFENQTTALLSLLCRLEGYLELSNKQGILWKGTLDLPPQLHWNFQGLQLFQLPSIAQSSKVCKISEVVTQGKEEVIEATDQKVLILNSGEGTITVKGSGIPFISVECCAFTTIKIGSDIPELYISNCQFVTISCSGNVGNVQLERCKSCVLGIRLLYSIS